MNQQEHFHTGKRLALARKISGIKQEMIIEMPGFPQIDVRTVRGWERKGINLMRLKEVADFFGVSLTVFIDPDLTPSQFMNAIAEAINQHNQEASKIAI